MSDFLTLYFVFLCVIGKLKAVVGPNITTCDGKTRHGYVINVVYEKFDAHENCTCTIRPMFTGVLRFASNTISFACDTEVNVFETTDPEKAIMRCGNQRTSVNFNVTANSVLSMVSKTITSTVSKSYQEIKVFKVKTFDGNISVTCGNKTSWSMSTTDIRLSTSDWEHTSLGLTAELSYSTEHTYRSTTYVPSRPVEGDTQSPNEDLDLTYIILGVSGIVAALLLVSCILVFCCVRRNRSKSDGKEQDYSNAHNHTNAGYRDELPDNPLYHSHQPFNDVEYTTVYEQRPDPPSTRQTEEVKKVYGDETNDVYAKPNKSKNVQGNIIESQSNTFNVSGEIQMFSGDHKGEVVYAQVNKEVK